jgi:hypothetical protein
MHTKRTDHYREVSNTEYISNEEDIKNRQKT